MELNYKHRPGRIWAEGADGALLAEIDFAERGGVAQFAHTFVDSSLRGQGVGDKLVRMALERVRADGHRAVATCSYVRAWFERHPEEGDILVKADGR